MSVSSSSSKRLTAEDFVSRALGIQTYQDLDSLRKDAVQEENLFRELFARKRESWEIPEIDDPYLFLVDVYTHKDLFVHLEKFPEDSVPRCFPLDKRQPERSLAIVPNKQEFDISWDCLTEGILRFLNWDNVLAAGGAVAGCLAPLPLEVAEGGPSATRVKRRKYFHDKLLPGSDVDLFLYGLNETQAEEKLLEIYDAVQAANPYEIRAFRSAHAITLVSRYPFRHVQIVTRLYNSPSEVLMGFDVDACAVGYDGKKVVVCPRTALAMMSQSNTVDMTRRSPSYEMRLAKYAQRGFEVEVPDLDRDRVDPFLYEKRFDQTKGLARLLMLERLRTPEERFRYRIEGQLKAKGHSHGNLEWMVQQKIRKMAGDTRNLDRTEGTEGIVPNVSGPEASDYSTVFLPWGPEWTADRIERLTKKKDKILNKIEFKSDGRVTKCRRPYKIHVCAVGTMAEVLEDPFPEDPPIPDNVPPEALESTVRGKLSWLVDNPGRQQIGSFHPITDEDWREGAYISRATEDLVKAANANDGAGITELLNKCGSDGDASALLAARDFLGRTVLHVAVLAKSADACRVLLDHPGADEEFLKSRIADGRTALHLAAMRGDTAIIKLILDKRKQLAEKTVKETGGDLEEVAVEILDMDGADWEVKMNALQYAVVLGHVEAVRVLLSYGANARKIAVHKDRNESLSLLSLLALYASECGEAGLHAIRPMAELLIGAGASTAQVDTVGSTCWHRFAVSKSASSSKALEIVLEIDAAKQQGGKARALDVLNSQMQTALYVATTLGNAQVIRLLLKGGATACFSEQEWEAKGRQMRDQASSGAGGGNVHSMMHQINMAFGDGSGRYNEMGEAMRCPVSLAAQNADVPCLEAFLSHQPALANAAIHLPHHNIRGYNQLGAGGALQQQQESLNVSLRPLDLLEKTRTTVLNVPEHMNNTIANAQAHLHSSQERLDAAIKRRDTYPVKSYQWFGWSLVVVREKEAVEMAKTQAEAYELTEEDTRDEKEAIKQIDDACRTVREAGGECHPKNDTETKNQTQTSTQHGIFAHHMHATPVNVNLDPFQSYAEISVLDFNTASSMGTGHVYRQNVVLPNSDRKAAYELMAAVSDGDADKISEALSQSKVCITDSFGGTPLYLAVMTGNIDSVRAIFQAAKEQYEQHVEKQTKLQEQRQAAAAGDDVDDEETLVKDQLRRLNNLDIAAGEMPRNAGPTPDLMRQRLEEAEAAAIGQAEAATSAKSFSSSTPPEALLLDRSITLDDEVSEPRLTELKSRLSERQAWSFSENWLGKPVRMRAIELAVVKTDIKMVKFLLELATEVIGDDENEAPSDDKDEEDEMEDEEDEIDDEDEEDYDEEDDEENYNAGGATKGTARINANQLRYLLTGEASRNPDTGMTLLQLAVAANDVSIFCEIASYAREYSLPRGAVASWKLEIDSNDNDEVDEATKLTRQKETDLISGNGQSQQHYYYGPGRLPLWTPSDNSHMNYANQISIHPTPLQFALAVGAGGVAGALMSGEADSALLDWITESNREAETAAFQVNQRNRRGGNSGDIEGPSAAASWIKRHVSESACSRAEICRRLIRPTALDSVGRSALFYAPAESVAEVVNSAVAATEQDGEAAPTRSMFLQSLSARGRLTALMAAASALEIDKVRALIGAGCNRSKGFGPKSWGPIHLAIPSKRNSNANAIYHRSVVEGVQESDTDRWEKARKIIELILDGAAESELDEALLCPDAEHTPLMLAADRGADSETISYLIKRTAARAVKGLAARDVELNSALHLAVGAALNDESLSLDSVIALLDCPDTAAVLGPNAENARGLTPLELAMQAVVSVWARSQLSSSGANRIGRHRQFARTAAAVRSRAAGQDPERRRQNMGKSPLPPKPSSESVDDEAFVGRKAYSLLNQATASDTNRLPSGFDDIREAKKTAAEKAKSSVASANQSRFNRWGGMGQETDESQSEPNGPPVVLPKCQNYDHNRQWSGWQAFSRF